MEQRYKDAVRALRKTKLSKAPPAEYRQHLFPVGWSYKEYNSIEITPVKESEKAQVIDSLKDFGQNLLDENKTDSIKLDKIEIAKKNANSFDEPESFTREFVISTTSSESFEARYKIEDIDRSELGSLKVIFVADNLREDFLTEPKSELTEFEALFDTSTAALFSKMVKAMKLSKSDYLLTAIKFKEDKSILDTVLSEIHHFKPTLVVSLGVSASHALIDTTQRLKDLHGNFYPIKIDGYDSQVMPLFSPSLLNSAPHMKSITWIDMQKAMEKLGL